MGMYDTIEFRCPNCQGEVEEQVDYGECDLAHYPENAVPIDIAQGLVGKCLRCYHCGSECLVEGETEPPRVVSLRLVRTL